MTGPATTAQWLAGAGIGTGVGAVALWLLKVALDGGPLPDYWATRTPPPRPAPPMPSYAPTRRAPRHAAPPALDETQPVTCVQPTRARHSKGPAVTWTT